jgi:hypothetical protein
MLSGGRRGDPGGSPARLIASYCSVNVTVVTPTVESNV